MNIIDHPFFETTGEPRSIKKTLELPESQSRSYKYLPTYKPKPLFQPNCATDVDFYNPAERYHSNFQYEREDKQESSNAIWWLIGFLLLTLIGYSFWRHFVERREGG